jgi:hypothetical protein
MEVASKGEIMRRILKFLMVKGVSIFVDQVPIHVMKSVFGEGIDYIKIINGLNTAAKITASESWDTIIPDCKDAPYTSFFQFKIAKMMDLDKWAKGIKKNYDEAKNNYEDLLKEHYKTLSDDQLTALYATDSIVDWYKANLIQKERRRRRFDVLERKRL